MAYAYVQDVASSWQQYQHVAAELVEPLPDGLILHVAGPTDEGVRIIEIWDDERASERFRSERLAPALAVLLGDTWQLEPTFRELHPEHVVLRTRPVSPVLGGEKEER